MSRTPVTLLVLVVSAISACSTPGPRVGTEVTRFHLNQPIAPGAINMEPADEAREESIEFRTYESVVADALTQLGFEPVEGDEAAIIAVVDVSQTVDMQAPERSPFSIGFGAGSYGGSSGSAVGASTDVGGSQGGEVTVTQLEVQFVNRAENNVIWEGRAVRTSEPGAGNRPIATVQMLAAALFQEFPGESGSTTTIP